MSGDPYENGEYVDEWGCRFVNIHRGIIGEVKEPLIEGEEWEDIDKLKPPAEMLNIDKEGVVSFCRQSEKFVIGGTCPRPWERLQFVRGTENLYIDLALKREGMFDALKTLHQFYCDELEAWGKTDVDGLMFMDDWGSQQSLLINPNDWVAIFKPLYKDYIDIAHTHNKKALMHSDGYILSIIPYLIELGLDAVNSQIFCMGVDKLEQFKGKITFWGEIDRQHLLPNGSLEDIAAAVKEVKKSLWSEGGCIAQCEFGPGANPDNVYQVFKSWNEVK